MAFTKLTNQLETACPNECPGQ